MLMMNLYGGHACSQNTRGVYFLPDPWSLGNRKAMAARGATSSLSCLTSCVQCSSGSLTFQLSLGIHVSSSFLACVLSCFSGVRLFATLQTEACQPPLSMGVLQARILEWVAMPSFRGSSQPKDWTQASCISCTAGKFFTNWATWEAPYLFLVNSKQSMKWGYSCPPSNYLHLQLSLVLIHAIHQKGSPTLLGKNIL